MAEILALEGFAFRDSKAHERIDEVEKIIGDLNIPINENVTPQMFGAVGDGVTNDTEAFVACFAERKPVFVPDGQYNVHNLNIPPNVTIIGESREGVIFTTDSECDSIFVTENFEEYTGTGVIWGTKNAIIKNITIDGNNLATYGMKLYGTRNSIEHVYVKNCGTGIYSEWCNELGMVDHLGTESFFSDICITQCSVIGMEYVGPHDAMFDKLIIALCQKGMHVYNKGLSIVDGTHFDQCHIYSNKEYGALCEGSCVFNGFESECNGFNNENGDINEQYGIKVTGYANLSGCRFHHNKGDGIIISGNGNRVEAWLHNNERKGLHIESTLSNSWVEVSATDDEPVHNLSNIDQYSCRFVYKNTNSIFKIGRGAYSSYNSLNDVSTFTNQTFNTVIALVNNYTDTVYYTPANESGDKAFNGLNTFVLYPGDTLTLVNNANIHYIEIV